MRGGRDSESDGDDVNAVFEDIRIAIENLDATDAGNTHWVRPAVSLTNRAITRLMRPSGPQLHRIESDDRGARSSAGNRRGRHVGANSRTRAGFVSGQPIAR